MQRDYGHGLYGSQRGMEPSSYPNSSYEMESIVDRFGPYDSYDSRSSLGGRDIYGSSDGYIEPEPSRYRDSYDDGFETSYRSSLDSFGGRNQDGSNLDAPYSRTNLRPGFMDDRGRDSYFSYSSFSSSLMKPASAGSRGRGMPAYSEGAFGSRSYDAFRGSSTGRGRGRGRGQMGNFRGVSKPGVTNQSNVGGAGRGKKRNIDQAVTKPVESAGKKAKVVINNNANKNVVKEVSVEEGEERKIDAKRERQRRRREKNSEMLAFTCSFCKFRTNEEKDIEAHLGSTTHQETLDHIQKQTKSDKVVMEFLHECMVNKFKKTSMRRLQSTQNGGTNIVEKDLMEGVTEDDHMMKVQTVHCSACSLYVPALNSSVQQHLKSPDHAKSKQAYKEQIKRESVLTATSILNNPSVKARYEQFAKGENPFEIVEQPQEPVVTNEAEETKETVDFAEDPAEQIDFTADYTEEN